MAAELDYGVTEMSAYALRPFGKDLWVIEGPRVRDTGIMFDTRMALVRLADGSLWVDSPVPVSYALLQQLTALGPVRYLISGTPRHVWRLNAWHALFPEAELWVCRPTPATLKGEPLPITGILGDGPHPGWAPEIEQVAFAGNPWIEEIIFYHAPSRTVMVDDLVQSHRLIPGRPLRNALARWGGVAAPDGGTSIDIRLSFIHRDAARRSLERILAWDFDRLILAHGPCLEQGGHAYLERAFRWLSSGG